MRGGAVHHDAGFRFPLTGFAEFCPVRSEIQTFRGKELAVLRPRNCDGPRIRSRKRSAAHQCVGVAADLVGRNRCPKGCIGGCSNGESAGEIVEAVIAPGYDPYTAVRCEILIFDSGIYVVANVVVAPGSCSSDSLEYRHSCPYPHGMNVGIAGCTHLGESYI